MNKKTMPKGPKKISENDRKLDAFKKACAAMELLSPQERIHVINAVVVIYSVSN